MSTPNCNVSAIVQKSYQLFLNELLQWSVYCMTIPMCPLSYYNWLGGIKKKTIIQNAAGVNVKNMSYN